MDELLPTPDEPDVAFPAPYVAGSSTAYYDEAHGVLSGWRDMPWRDRWRAGLMATVAALTWTAQRGFLGARVMLSAAWWSSEGSRGSLSRGPCAHPLL